MKSYTKEHYEEFKTQFRVVSQRFDSIRSGRKFMLVMRLLGRNDRCSGQVASCISSDAQCINSFSITVDVHFAKPQTNSAVDFLLYKINRVANPIKSSLTAAARFGKPIITPRFACASWESGLINFPPIGIVLTKIKPGSQYSSFRYRKYMFLTL